MDDARPIAETQTWLAVQLTAEYRTNALSHRIRSSPPDRIKIQYFGPNQGRLVINESKVIDFDPADIGSIELQTYAEYHGLSPDGFPVVVDDAIGGKRFAQESNIPYAALDKTPRVEAAPAFLFNAAIYALGAVACMAALLFATYLVLDLFFVVDRDSNPMLSRWWRDHYIPKPLATLIWIAFWVGVVGVGVYGAREAMKSARVFGIDGRRIVREPVASLHWSPAKFYLVVLHMVTGRSVVVASTYRDVMLAREMRADHVNAWASAKMQKPSAALEDSDDYI